MHRPAVFLDRDGVIVEETHYLSSPEQLKLIPGTAEAIARLNEDKIPVVVITNQSGVARGYFPESRVSEIHDALDALLKPYDAVIDAYYYCPHHPTAGSAPYKKACACRKPAPGLLLEAADRLSLDIHASIMIGDKISDLLAGVHAGCKPYLVRTGYGNDYTDEELEKPELQQLLCFENLLEAVDHFIRTRIRNHD